MSIFDTINTAEQATKKAATVWDREERSFTEPVPPSEHYTLDLVEGVPTSLVKAYARAARGHALVSQLDGDEWFAEVKGLAGVWGNGRSPLDAKNDLEASVFEWAALKLRNGSYIPRIEGLDLNPVEMRELAS